jgi:aerobic carbon-monoxide dehydrogenase medium subunit
VNKPADVNIPASRREAIDAFGDGRDVLVMGGGTILMPEINYGRLRPDRALLLHRSGLTGVRADEDRVVIGAAATLETVVRDAPGPLSDAAARIADPEVRRQATIGGNLSTRYAGDLQAVLLALDATVRHTGAGGEREDPVADYLAYLARPEDDRLALEIEFVVPDQHSYVYLDRPHAHPYTVMAVTAVRSGERTNVAVKGAHRGCVRLPSVEAALAEGADHGTAADRALEDADPEDDALASSWYRRRVLPTLVRRALAQLDH